MVETEKVHDAVDKKTRQFLFKRVPIFLGLELRLGEGDDDLSEVDAAV